MRTYQKPDFSKNLFTIKITVHENCSVFDITFDDPDYKPSYHEIIGVLEIQKTMHTYRMSEENRKEAVRQKRNKNKKP
jgi:hypothetical protein